MTSTLFLTNPHSALAALEVRPRDVLEVRLPAQGAGDAWQKMAGKAAKQGIPVTLRKDDGEAGQGARPRHQRGGRDRDDSRGRRGRPDGRGRAKPGEGAQRKARREGGGIALVREQEGLDPAELFEGAAQRNDGRALFLALDQVQDPRNVGAIFRSAAFFGVAGVLLSSDRSAPLTEVSYDTASGGLEHVPFAWASNLRRDLKAAREAGVWLLGAAEEAERPVQEVPRDRPWLLIVGNEESGLRRLTREACDDLCRLQARGPVRSLNVSVATAVLLGHLAAGD